MLHLPRQLCCVEALDSECVAVDTASVCVVLFMVKVRLHDAQHTKRRQLIAISAVRHWLVFSAARQ